MVSGIPETCESWGREIALRLAEHGGVAFIGGR